MILTPVDLVCTIYTMTATTNVLLFFLRSPSSDSLMRIATNPNARALHELLLPRSTNAQRKREGAKKCLRAARLLVSACAAHLCR